MKVQAARLPLYTIITFMLLSLAIAGWVNIAQAKSDVDNSILDKSSKAFVNVVKKAKPAVVHIRVEKTTSGGQQRGQEYDEIFKHPFFEQFFGPYYRHQQPRQPQQRERKQRGQGSGFIISKDGYILTNNHVIEDADVIKVSLSDNREFDARLIGADPLSDVALLKIDAPKNLPVVVLGDSDALEVGEWVIAIGNPFGLSQTVTVGVVSAKGRSSVGINQYENFIQTDAAINPGNSGGPLINGRGEVVGINTALFSKTGGYMGIGFAIPVNMAKSIEGQLQKQGKVTRGWLGVAIQDVTKELAESFGLKQTGGILINEVQENSPASKAGLKQGDVIVRLNDTVLENVSELRNKIALIIPNTKATLHIIRNGKEQQIKVMIGEQPSDFGQRGFSSNKDKNSLEDFGLSLQDLTKELAERLGYAENSGVVISDVQAGSPAAEGGLKPGYLIEEVNRNKVDNLQELHDVLKKSSQSKRILLRVRAADHSRYVVLTDK
jgi:serine protease Do